MQGFPTLTRHHVVFFIILWLRTLPFGNGFAPRQHNKNRNQQVAANDAAVPTNNNWVVVGAIGAIVSLSSLTAAPLPVVAADATKGVTLFQANCAGCHAGGQNFVSEKKTLQKQALEQYRKTLDPVELQAFVQKGFPHKFLPFSKEWSDADYENVISYVLDQALGEKW